MRVQTFVDFLTICVVSFATIWLVLVDSGLYVNLIHQRCYSKRMVMILFRLVKLLGWFNMGLRTFLMRKSFSFCTKELNYWQFMLIVGVNKMMKGSDGLLVFFLFKNLIDYFVLFGFLFSRLCNVISKTYFPICLF